MAYLKPPALTRHLANPLAMRLGGRGVATSPSPVVTLAYPEGFRSSPSTSARSATATQ